MAMLSGHGGPWLMAMLSGPNLGETSFHKNYILTQMRIAACERVIRNLK
jgi:hypothetical protein